MVFCVNKKQDKTNFVEQDIEVFADNNFVATV